MMRRMKQITGSRNSRAYGMPIQGEPGTHSFAWDKAAQYRDIDHRREQLERALGNASRSIAQNSGANALQR